MLFPLVTYMSGLQHIRRDCCHVGSRSFANVGFGSCGSGLWAFFVDARPYAVTVVANSVVTSRK